MRGSPERRRRGLRGRRMAPRRAGMTTSVPITHLFWRDTMQKSRSVIYHRGWSQPTDFASGSERNSEGPRGPPRKHRSSARGIDVIVDPEQTDPGANSEVLDQCRNVAHAGVPGRVSERKKWTAEIGQLNAVEWDHVVARHEQQAITAQCQEIHGRQRARATKVRKTLRDSAATG